MHSPFLIPVADLLADSGSRRVIELNEPISWGFEGASVGPAVQSNLVLENASGVLVVRGPAESELRLTCHRCLTEWDEPLAVDVTAVLGFGEDEDGYELAGDDADLEPVLRDALLLQVPLRPLCRSDCRGLCATCGADLNTESCPGHGEASSSPFAVLRDLLEP
jgi:uncharacterized protein